jgi:hypothetical protein
MKNVSGGAEAGAYAVKDIGEIKLTARPYNRFDPDSSTWWLIPSTEWPAFKFGKLFFDSSGLEDKHPTLHCGFYLEKGIGGGAASIYPRTIVMDRSWTWFSFLKSVPDSFPAFEGVIRLSIAASYINPEMAREFITPESFLAQKKEFGASRISFELRKHNQLSGVNVTTNDANLEIANHFKEKLSSVEDISVLMQRLQQLPYFDWTWIDINAGPIITYEEATAGADRLWRTYLRPWAKWLR